MCTTTEEFNISFDDHKEAIRRRIYDAWGTSQVVDSWMQKYPQWAHLGRKKFRDAARVSNPRSNKFSNDWREIYERTLAHYHEERRAHLEAAAGKASIAISDLVERVRSNVANVLVESAHDLLAVARAINPLKFIALHETSNINHGPDNPITQNHSGDTVDRLMRYQKMAEDDGEAEG